MRIMDGIMAGVLLFGGFLELTSEGLPNGGLEFAGALAFLRLSLRRSA